MDAKEKIKEGVQLYFDSMYESDPQKVRQAFHPNAMITGYLETGLAEMTVDQFAEFVESQNPSPKEKGDEILLEIVSCDIAGLEKDGEWKIYNKLFHVES